MKQLIGRTWLKGAMLASLFAGYSCAAVELSPEDIKLTAALVTALQDLDKQEAQEGDDVTHRKSCKRKGSRYYCFVSTANLLADNATIGNLTITGNETLAGSLTIDGGLSITDSLFVGGDTFFTGNASFTDTTASFATNVSVDGFLTATPSWAYAWNTAAGTVANNANVLFANTTSTSSDITLTTDTGTTLVTITRAGQYLFEFSVLGLVATGTTATGPALPLMFELFNQTTTTAVAGGVYTSVTQGSVQLASSSSVFASGYALTSLTSKGQLILTVAAGTTFRLRNVSTQTVTYNADNAGAGNVNASLLITRLN